MCSSRWAGGIFHVSYHDVKLSPDDLLAAINRQTTGEADQELAAAIATDAGRTCDWLASQGGAFDQASPIGWHRFTLAPPRLPVAGQDWQGRGPDRLLGELGRPAPGATGPLRQDLGGVLDAIDEGAAFYREIGDSALDAPEPDLELAFERYKQAILISGEPDDRERIIRVRDRLAAGAQRPAADAEMATHRARLLEAVREFLAHLPRELAGP
jgi:hypothetical protein